MDYTNVSNRILFGEIMDRNLFKKITSVPGMENASEDDIQRFLDVISHMESSGGKNVNHSPAIYGVSKGDTAEGQHGLMPKTKKELQKRFTNAKEEEIPNELARMLLNKTGGDEEAASVGWRFGHNMSRDRLKERKSEDYPSSFKRNMDEVIEGQKKIPEALSKYDFSKLKVLLGK